MLRSYYDGNARLEYAGRKFREAFGDLFRDWSDNFLALVVDAVAERLSVEGFRVPIEDGAEDDQRQADKDAWTIWQRNHLDADSHLAHLDSLVVGCGFVSVWADPGTPGEAIIAVEDPCEVYVEHVPGSRRKRKAALKRWVDEDTRLVHATLYRPDAIYKYVSTDPLREGSSVDTARYVPREVDPPEAWPVENALGVVPIIPLPNRPRSSGAYESEIDQFRALQDGMNKVLADMLVASEFVAYPQRWATGIDIPLDENGAPMEPFKAGVDRVWTLPPVEEGDQASQFGQFPAADLAPYVAAVEMLVAHLSSRSRTPPHYLLGQAGVFPSGESLKAAETGLVAKTRLKMRPLGEAWEEAMSLAFRIEGDDTRADVLGKETLWRNPESRSSAETTDAAIKMQALGVPQEALWTFIGATPQEVGRWRVMRAEEAETIANAFGATPPPTTPPGPTSGAQAATRPIASLDPTRQPANGNTPPPAPVPGR